MGTKYHVVVVGGHAYSYYSGNGHLIPLTEAGEQYVIDTLNRHPAVDRADGYYVNGPDCQKLNVETALDADSRRVLCELATERVPPEEHAEALDRLTTTEKQLARTRNQLRQMTIAKLDCTRIGDAVSFHSFAYRDNNYAKGVRVFTTENRVVDFYGARREDVSLVAIDRTAVGWVGDERDEDIEWNCKHTTKHLIESARANWRGKQKVERENERLAEVGDTVLII